MLPSDDGDAKDKELTMDEPHWACNHCHLGGTVEGASVVDPIGIVEFFDSEGRTNNKVQQGLEFALRNVPYCKHIKYAN